MVETVECGDIHEEKAVLYEDRIGFAGINQGGEFIFCPGRCNFLCCDSSGPNSLQTWEAKPVISFKGCAIPLAKPKFCSFFGDFLNSPRSHISVSSTSIFVGFTPLHQRFFPSSPWTVEVPKLCKKGFK
jgi:hypothetical protein